VGALTLAAALFRIADGAVVEAADAAAPPRRLDPAATKARAGAAEARGVCVAASAAATANTDLAVSSLALPRPPTSPSPKGRLDAESGVALRTARGLRRATARIMAAHDAPVAVARRLRAAALAGIARHARGTTARAVAAAAGADAAAAALVRLPPDVGNDDCGLGEGAPRSAPAAGARAPPPTPAAKRRVRAPLDSTSGHRLVCVGGAPPVRIAGRTRGAWLRAAAVAPPHVAGVAAGPVITASPAEAHAAASVPPTLRVSRESDVGEGLPATSQTDGCRAASALCSTSNAHARAPVAVSPPDEHGVRAAAPAVAPPAASPPLPGRAARPGKAAGCSSPAQSQNWPIPAYSDGLTTPPADSD